jgi:hypothetical protein
MGSSYQKVLDVTYTSDAINDSLALQGNAEIEY